MADPKLVEEMADPELVEEMGDEICLLAAHIHAARGRLLTLLARFDRVAGEPEGHRSCAHWLSFHTGLDLGAAREHVRVARALAPLPHTAEAMARGELSFSQVRALTRVAEPETEAALLELARGVTTARLEGMVRAARKGTRQHEAERERERHRARTFSVFPDDDGMYVVRGLVPAEVGAVLMKAVEAAGDVLFRERVVPGPPAEDGARQAARRRADALGLVAERALGAGFGAGAEARGEACGGHGTQNGCGDTRGVGGGGEAHPVPISGTRAERLQVLLLVDEAAVVSEDAALIERVAQDRISAETSQDRISAETPEAGRATPFSRPVAQDRISAETSELARVTAAPRAQLPDGTRLSHETARRLCCDASIARVTRARDGSVIDVGRKTRSIPPGLRRALEVRDGGCRFPGCGLPFTDGHHIRHWADGGATNLGNCLLLCRYHHRLVHEEGWSVRWWGEGRPEFTDPRGQSHFDGGWRPPRLPERPVESLIARNRARGADPDARTAGARWRREEDIPDVVFYGASEAL